MFIALTGKAWQLSSITEKTGPVRTIGVVSSTRVPTRMHEDLGGPGPDVPADGRIGSVQVAC
jgi:hypothetical protein